MDQNYIWLYMFNNSYFENIQVSKYLRGEVGVMFTNKTKDEVQE